MPLIPQAPSSYEIHETCQIENLGYLLEQLPEPFGIFNPEKKGRFVEVGSFDGITYSNVWGLAKAGWPGIMIEPMLENVDKCREEHKDRPWVIIEPVGCGENGETVQMYFEREGSRIARPGEFSYPVKIKTLDSILHKHNWQPGFELLVIDTEDYEQQVLKGFDLVFWHPLLVIVETHGWQREWIHEWFAHGYGIYYEDGLNSIFLRK